MLNILSKKPTWNYWDDNVKHENLSTAATDDKEETSNIVRELIQNVFIVIYVFDKKAVQS